MPFQKGNTLSKGVTKGKTGRKSAYEEFEAAKRVHELLNLDQDVNELEEKIQKKRYSGWDAIKLRVLKGDKTLGSKMVDKVVPDLHKLQGDSDQPIVIKWEE